MLQERLSRKLRYLVTCLILVFIFNLEKEPSPTGLIQGQTLDCVESKYFTVWDFYYLTDPLVIKDLFNAFDSVP